MQQRGRHWLIASLVGCLTIALFVLDVHTPLGVSNHALYVGAVLLAFLSPLRTFPFLVAALCSVLIVVTGFISPNSHDLPLWVPISNRFFSLIVIWIPLAYLHQRRKHEEALLRLNDELDRRVKTRTKELASVNDALVVEVSERMQTERLLTASRRELRLLAAQLLRVQDQERRRISRDLHDDINQRLALLIIEVDRLVQQEPLVAGGRIAPAVRTLQDRLVELSDSVRHLAYQFHPSILDDLGLSIALQRLAEDFQARTNIPCRMTHQGQPPALTQDAATCLYRVAQECLSNVARHAKAAQVELTLEQTGESQTLTIADDGVGFEPARLDAGRTGLGMISMNERVALAEGTMTMTSAPGKGTQIVVTVPGLPEET